MKRLVTLALLLAAASPLAAQAVEPYRNAPGPCAVETVLYDWHDAARNRDVPVKIYYPKEATEKSPLIIFSHGLGGSREGYEYLGRRWASWGYVSAHLTHKGSDTEVWKGAGDKEGIMKGMRAAVADPRNAVQRPLDVQFAIDRMTALNAEDSPFKGRLDLDRIGVAGHSFGAWTTLAVAGQGSPALERSRLKLADPRVKAAIEMSAPVARPAQRDAAYSAIRIPMFHMTGTLDDSPIGDTKAAERRIPFDRITGADGFLVTFAGGDHMVFSGRPRTMAGGEKDPLFHDLILQGTTAFWDAYLKGDAKAKEWLADGGFEKVLGQDGKFEKKPAGK